MAHVQAEHLIPAPVGLVFKHIADFNHLGFWLPPELQAEISSLPKSIGEKSEIEARLARYGISLRMRVRLTEFLPEKSLVYRQVQGFFASWEHIQKLKAHDPATTLLTDLVDFEMPFGIVGALIDDLFMRNEVRRILQYRQEQIAASFNAVSKGRQE